MCSEFELREGRRPALADADKLQHRARELVLEARAEVAAEHPGTPLPKGTIPEDVLPTEVSVARQHWACLPGHHSAHACAACAKAHVSAHGIPCHSTFFPKAVLYASITCMCCAALSNQSPLTGCG